MYIMFDIVDTPFSYGRGLIVCSSLQEFSMTKESTPVCDLKCRYYVFTLWGRTGFITLLLIGSGIRHFRLNLS